MLHYVNAFVKPLFVPLFPLNLDSFIKPRKYSSILGNILPPIPLSRRHPSITIKHRVYCLFNPRFTPFRRHPLFARIVQISKFFRPLPLSMVGLFNHLLPHWPDYPFLGVGFFSLHPSFTTKFKRDSIITNSSCSESFWWVPPRFQPANSVVPPTHPRMDID